MKEWIKFGFEFLLSEMGCLTLCVIALWIGMIMLIIALAIQGARGNW